VAEGVEHCMASVRPWVQTSLLSKRKKKMAMLIYLKGASVVWRKEHWTWRTSLYLSLSPFPAKAISPPNSLYVGFFPYKMVTEVSFLQTFVKIFYIWPTVFSFFLLSRNSIHAQGFKTFKYQLMSSNLYTQVMASFWNLRVLSLPLDITALVAFRHCQLNISNWNDPLSKSTQTYVLTHTTISLAIFSFHS
jgi:hypothetical protein